MAVISSSSRSWTSSLGACLIGIRSTPAQCAASKGSRSATKLKKLCNAPNRQFRVPIELGYGFLLFGSYKPEKQPPTVPVGQHGVMGDVSLLHQPVVKEGVQKVGKGSGLHAFPPFAEARRIWAPRTRNRSL